MSYRAAPRPTTASDGLTGARCHGRALLQTGALGATVAPDHDRIYSAHVRSVFHDTKPWMHSVSACTLLRASGGVRLGGARCG